VAAKKAIGTKETMEQENCRDPVSVETQPLSYERKWKWNIAEEARRILNTNRALSLSSAF